MKRIFLGIAMSLIATGAIAGTSTKELLYPQDACAQILSQEYSTGGGKKLIQYVEILCVDAEGNYKGFVASWGSASGFIGFGRFTVPDIFKYTPYDGDVLKVK